MSSDTTGPSMVDAVVEDILELESELHDEIARLEARIDELEERTNLLALVEDADQLEAEQRSVAILQHMHRKIRHNDLDRVSLTRDDVKDALHYPDLHRTTFYEDMKRCQRLVGDEDVCKYVPREESHLDGAHVTLDLSDGELPAKFSTGGDGL